MSLTSPSFLPPSPSSPPLSSSLLPPPLPPLSPPFLQCIIYHLVRFPRLQSLLTNERIQEELQNLQEASYVDRDLLFDETRNCDYSHTSGGVSRDRFLNHYHSFIRVCVQQQGLEVGGGRGGEGRGGEGRGGGGGGGGGEGGGGGGRKMRQFRGVSCCSQVDDGADSFLVTLSFAFTLLGRRMFFQHAQSGSGRRG